MGTQSIIVLHGWSYDTTKWQSFLKLLPSAQLLTIPGLTQPLDRPWSLDDYVSWLKSKINRPTIIIGHSNGGRIALAFTGKYPEKVQQLILIDSAGIHHFSLKRIVFSWLAKLGQPLKQFKFLRKIVYRLIGERDYLQASPIMRQTMANLTSTDLTPLLSSIKVPTLIIWGQQDSVTPLQDGQLMHQLIPHSKVKIIPQAHHSPQFTHPGEVATIIHEYL